MTKVQAKTFSTACYVKQPSPPSWVEGYYVRVTLKARNEAGETFASRMPSLVRLGSRSCFLIAGG